MALFLSRRKAENNSNKIILNEIENRFINWLVQWMFTHQGLQLGTILWECKSNSLRPRQWDVGEMERAKEGHNIGKISMWGNHMTESLNTHRNHISKVFFEENQQNLYCGIKQWASHISASNPFARQLPCRAIISQYFCKRELQKRESANHFGSLLQMTVSVLFSL